MEDVPIWEDLISFIDAVFETAVDDPTIWLSKLRFLWLLTTTALDKVNSGELLSIDDFEIPEKEILIKQAIQLGFDYQETDQIESEDYQRIVRNVALYWYSKGKPDFIDFLGFVLNTACSVENLWSNSADALDWKSYGTFLPEGDPGIGSPVWQAGTWFPTTHVNVVIDPFKFTSPSLTKLVRLFYTIANFNLVLKDVVLEGNLNIHSVDDPVLAHIVVGFPIFEVLMVIESV
jgi:hypothetical protein